MKYYINYLETEKVKMIDGDDSEEKSVPTGAYVGTDGSVMFEKKGSYRVWDCIGFVRNDESLKYLQMNICTKVTFGEFTLNEKNVCIFIVNKNANTVNMIKTSKFHRVNEGLTCPNDTKKLFTFAICEIWCKMVLKEINSEILAADLIDAGTCPYSLGMVRKEVEGFLMKYKLEDVILPTGSGRLHARDCGGRIGHVWKKIVKEELIDRSVFPGYLTELEEITPHLLKMLDPSYESVYEAIRNLPDPEKI